MKRIAIFGVHLSYWTIYLLVTAILFTVIIASIERHTGIHNSIEQNAKIIDNGVLAWKNIFFYNNFLAAPIGFYLFYFVLFSKINNRKKWYQIVFYGIILVLISSIITTLAFIFFKKARNLDINILLPFFILMTSIVALSHGCLGLFMRSFFNWFNLRKEKEQLTKQNHLIEMELVKAQLNPHFLFNSLNNIDVLIYKDQDQASAYLNKLSDIMRYMLFETKTELISFGTEYHFIEKYIALHQLRASNSDYVLLTNEIENQNGNVASLVFMPFIENAFKYSSSYKDGNAIQIQFQQKENQLYFSCKNRITKDNEVFSTSNGLGNELLKKRLDLIYKEHYTLNLQEENGYFCVALTIPYEAN